MPDTHNLIGQQIGNYYIIAGLSGGSYSSVYLGKHIIFDDDSIVAIKLLRAHLNSPQERTNFIQEAQLLKRLKHPHILPILDAGIHNGLPYLVLEYVSRGSLRQYLDQHPGQALPLQEALIILLQIGQALQHAHQQNIVHCDLKPENILFSAQGQALLADFGIAAILTTVNIKHPDLSGTPDYMAPEQFESIVSTRSDQYALGCIAYELVTGRKPFILPNPSVSAMWYQHAKVDPVPPIRYNPYLHIHIQKAILKALAKTPIDRHTDIFAFMAALQMASVQWFMEGKRLQALKNYEEALAAYERAIGLNAEYAEAYNSKGIVLRDLKRYEEALAAYERAIVLYPNHPYAHNNKGIVLRDLKRYEQAIAAYEQAIGLNPNDATIYYNKGNALSDLKRYEEAAVAYEQAIRLNPGHARAYFGKGIALEHLSRPKEAQQAYEQARLLGYSG